MDIQLKQVKNSILFGEIKRMLKIEGRKSVTITVKGYSMRPFLEHIRDKVVLVKPLPPRKGQVILAEVEPDIYILHKIIKIDGDIITMRGDGNALSQTETFHADKIVATVKTFIRKGKTIEADSHIWRTYSCIWEILRPLRRILLAIYRRVFNIIYKQI